MQNPFIDANKNKLVIVVHKPSVESQLDAILIEFDINFLTIIIQSDSGRIDEKTISQWGCVRKFDGRVEYLKIDFGVVNRAYLKRYLERCKPFTHVALPMFVNSAYWMNVPWLKKISTVISVSDGSIENTTIEDLTLRMKIKGFGVKDFLKLCVMPSVIRSIGMADICFHPYWPEYNSCLAKLSKPPGNFLMSDKKIKFIKDILNKHQPKMLIISGFEHKIEDLLSRIGGSSWISTSKGKAIICNGIVYDFDEYICAEELMTEFEPDLVIGYASDAVCIAKKMHPRAECIVVESSEISKHWGLGYNKAYKKQTNKLNIKYVK